ncbi:phosphonate ABC transporter, permease protein PhnE [Enemella evansiae]|uniref:phosphonate ABC transporter, permease protein PhnE n=1 Tax=Enemella evansiae TaxID=2016499 RepID=UPI000B97962C|nr:phosphonate ABC transporter, permease protein PhnE [Enemella evansiae]OYO01778.1 phosphonate ABC transporter permease [Enemella evansiae]
MTTIKIDRPQSSAGLTFPPRPAPSVRGVAAAVIMLGLLAAAIWSTIELRINVASFIDSADNAGRFIRRMVPLDFPPAGELLGLIGQTLSIVLLATLLGVVLSIPVALLAAWNTTTGNGVRVVSRGVIVLARAIPDLILAIFFMRVFGLGALPGVIAMGLHSVGMVGKLYADAIESLDNGPQEAIRAAGGGRLQQITAGILVPLTPQIIATALHRFDINLRTSVLLGYVGVGGIGLAMADSLRSLNYRRGMALAFAVLVLCIAVELLSGALRTAILAQTGSSGGRTSWSDRLTRRIAGVGDRGSVAVVGARERLSPPWDGARQGRFGGIAVFVMLIVAAFIGSGIRPTDLVAGIGKVIPTMGFFLPPGGWDIIDDIAAQMLTTIQIGLAATLLGAILAIPVGILAARNVVGNRVVATCLRVFIVIVRGIPELIVAIIFVVISGLGGVAGTMALAIGAVGLLGKLVADSLEETDTAVQDALRASGATRLQVFFGATLRQALPAFVAHLMYLLDVNIRSATLLGIVGAGGIGFLLLNAARVLEFPVVTTILLFILATVLIVEALAVFVRKAVR